ncbi:hypothetical protein Tco_0087994 [Tanacetum coccineum]
MESLNSNSQERELYQLQQMQHKAKESCMKSFRLLQSHLQVLSYNDLKINGCLERAFATLFEQDVQTFTGIMLLNLDQLEKQLDKDEFQGDRSMAAFCVINKQFQMFIDTQFTWDYDSQMTEKYFAEYTGIEVKQFRETLLLHMGNVKKSLAERTRHKRQYDRRMNERQMQSRESKVVSSKALDASLVVTECSGTKSDEHITSSSSGTYITHAVDADIRPVNDQVPFAEVQLTAQHNVLANEQQHTDQSKPSYDTYLLEKVDSNTTPDSTNMCHRGGEIDQDAEQYQAKSPLLKAEFLKMNDMVEKEDAPEFCEFFEINDLKAQLQAKTTLICNLKNQIKSVKEASNEAKVKHEIDVLETINIELESSVAKLLAENEKLNKENENLKQTYKELYDSIKKTRIQMKDHNDSLIAQVNKHTKPVEPKSHTQKPSRQIAIGQRFSPKKSSAVHEKPNTPRSCLRWKPTGRIFKIAGLRWIPTGKMFTDNTTKVDSEPSNGSNDVITNSYECDQTLNVSAGTTNLSADDVCSHQFRPHSSSIDNVCSCQFRPRSSTIDDMTSVHISSGLALQRQMASANNTSGPAPQRKESVLPGLKLTPGYISLGLVQNLVSSTPYVPPSKKDYEILFQPLFDEYFNPPPRAVSLDPVVVAAQELLIQSVQLRQLPLIKMYHLLVLTTKLGNSNLKNATYGNLELTPFDLQLEAPSLLDHKIQQLSKGSSEGSGTTPEVPDEPKDNSAVVAEKQAGYVQTNLTLSSAELEIQSMVDVPIHQEDLAVQRTPLIDPVISMTFQEEFRSAGWCKENSDGQKTVAEDMGFNLLVHSFRALSTLRCSGLRTASAAAKPCQGDSSEVYLITGRINDGWKLPGHRDLCEHAGPKLHKLLLEEVNPFVPLVLINNDLGHGLYFE